MDEEIQRCAELKIELSLLAVQLNTFAVDDEGKQPNQDLAVHHILGVIEKCLHPADELSRDGKVFHACFCATQKLMRLTSRSVSWINCWRILLARNYWVSIASVSRWPW